MKTFTLTFYDPQTPIDKQSLSIYLNVTDFDHFSDGEVEFFTEEGNAHTVQLDKNRAMKVELEPEPKEAENNQ